MNSPKDLIIIGAGASGLFAAASPALATTEVLVIEKMPQPGLKLLITGSGECNITNDDDKEAFLTHFGGNGNFLKPSFYSFPQSSLLSFLDDLGLKTQCGKNGKVFIAGGALRLRDRLVSRIHSLNHTLITNLEIIDLKRTDGLYYIKTRNDTFSAKLILLCPGGKSYPGTGSDGTAYHLATGHNITSIVPSLSPISIEAFPLSALSGISFSSASIKLKPTIGKSQRYYGPSDLLITHKGFSGPLILNNSRNFIANDQMEICWNSALTQEWLDQFFLNIRSSHPKRQLLSLHQELQIPKSLYVKLIQLSNCDPNQKICDVSKKTILSIKTSLLAWPCRIKSPGDFSFAMATSGGIDLKEVDRKTMMSRIHEGLFFAGEFLDIDGDTGGYNLQAVFSTSWAAALGIHLYLNKGPIKSEVSP